MGNADYYKKNSFNRICDRCGFKVKAENTKPEWNGAIVCKRHWESRQPLDKLRGRPDRQSVPNPRPDPDPVYLTVNQVTVDDL